MFNRPHKSGVVEQLNSPCDSLMEYETSYWASNGIYFQCAVNAVFCSDWVAFTWASAAACTTPRWLGLAGSWMSLLCIRLWWLCEWSAYCSMILLKRNYVAALIDFESSHAIVINIFRSFITIGRWYPTYKLQLKKWCCCWKSNNSSGVALVGGGGIPVSAHRCEVVLPSWCIHGPSMVVAAYFFFIYKWQVGLADAMITGCGLAP